VRARGQELLDAIPGPAADHVEEFDRRRACRRQLESQAPAIAERLWTGDRQPQAFPRRRRHGCRCQRATEESVDARRVQVVAADRELLDERVREVLLVLPGRAVVVARLDRREQRVRERAEHPPSLRRERAPDQHAEAEVRPRPGFLAGNAVEHAHVRAEDPGTAVEDRVRTGDAWVQPDVVEIRHGPFRLTAIAAKHFSVRAGQCQQARAAECHRVDVRRLVRLEHVPEVQPGSRLADSRRTSVPAPDVPA